MTDDAAARARIEAVLRAVPWFCTQHQRPAAECSHDPANGLLIEVPDYAAMAAAVATFAASERTRAHAPSGVPAGVCPPHAYPWPGRPETPCIDCGAVRAPEASEASAAREEIERLRAAHRKLVESTAHTYEEVARLREELRAARREAETLRQEIARPCAVCGRPRSARSEV